MNGKIIFLFPQCRSGILRAIPSLPREVACEEHPEIRFLDDDRDVAVIPLTPLSVGEDVVFSCVRRQKDGELYALGWAMERDMKEEQALRARDLLWEPGTREALSPSMAFIRKCQKLFRGLLLSIEDSGWKENLFNVIIPTMPLEWRADKSNSVVYFAVDVRTRDDSGTVILRWDAFSKHEEAQAAIDHAGWFLNQLERSGNVA